MVCTNECTEPDDGPQGDGCHLTQCPRPRSVHARVEWPAVLQDPHRQERRRRAHHAAELGIDQHRRVGLGTRRRRTRSPLRQTSTFWSTGNVAGYGGVSRWRAVHAARAKRPTQRITWRTEGTASPLCCTRSRCAFRIRCLRGDRRDLTDRVEAACAMPALPHGDWRRCRRAPRAVAEVECRAHLVHAHCGGRAPGKCHGVGLPRGDDVAVLQLAREDEAGVEPTGCAARVCSIEANAGSTTNANEECVRRGIVGDAQEVDSIAGSNCRGRSRQCHNGGVAWLGRGATRCEERGS